MALTIDDIEAETIEALIHGELPALVLDEVMTEQECDSACEAIRRLTSQSTYRWATDLTVVGTSVGEAHESPEAEERYFNQAAATAALLSREVFPFGSPVGRIVKRIAEVWPAGVVVPEKNGRGFLPEIARRWVSGGGANPHIDQSGTHLLGPLGIGRRLGLNVYMSMPEVGGAIEFWKRALSDEEYVRLKRPDYGLDREILGPADLTLKPKKGQAVLFRAWEPHAVEPVSGAVDRITNAAFLAVGGAGRSLAQFA